MPMKLYPGNHSDVSCGPTALYVLTGIPPEDIGDWIVEYRRKHPHNLQGLPCKRQSMAPSADVIFHHEAEAFLRWFFGVALKFRSCPKVKVSQFIRSLPKDKTYLVHSQIHLLVTKGHRVWDTEANGKPYQCASFMSDLVDCFIEIPGKWTWRKTQYQRPRTPSSCSWTWISNPYDPFRAFRYYRPWSFCYQRTY